MSTKVAYLGCTEIFSLDRDFDLFIARTRVGKNTLFPLFLIGCRGGKNFSICFEPSAGLGVSLVRVGKVEQCDGPPKALSSPDQTKGSRQR